MGQQKEREVYMKKKLVVVILVIICIAEGRIIKETENDR